MSGTASRRGFSARRAAFVAGRVVFVWALAIAFENVVVGLGYRALFAGYWEMALARRFLSPLLLTVLAPAAVAVGLYVEATRYALAGRASRTIGPHVVVAFLFGAAVALSVSTGRHLQSLVVRVPFVVVTGALAAGVAHVLLPRLLARSVGTRATIGLGLAAAFWIADSFVLPRLYPGFHLACFVLFLASVALTAPSLPRVFDKVGAATLLAAAGLGAFVKTEARGAARSDNLRIVLLDRAPLLGRAVRIAAWVAPPEDTDEPTQATTAVAASEVPRALDWTGNDLVLVTVDALRADHVSSYGYARKTTPEIDALAARGTRFAHAYCPTPHTSYSVTSMLTGKYMKPLLSLGVGEGSETMASHLRRYGYRTAAFYPPAVFFIDESRFVRFRDSGLDFEYRKVEFTDRALRIAQITKYMQTAPKDKPLFLWVHLFEPHEPYVVHDAHVFGDRARGTDVDAYDSEVAEADQTVGEIVRLVEGSRPRATFVVTADHGEEFGEHGGRYHGTTVYEEQVRVPLVVVGKGVKTQTLDAPVETIDILPTALSALGIPRPARVRGRDLGPVLKEGETTPAQKAGFAFAETDDFTLVAEGGERLVCARKIAACALYDLAHDPLQTRDVGPTSERTKALRKKLAETERDHGRYEGGQKLPDALRRGKQGEADAAEDVAALFDDASLVVRREAAEVAFWLDRGEVTANAARRALAREEDDTTRRFLALTLVRASDAAPGAKAVAEKLFADPDLAWRRRAALAFADAGDPRGVALLAGWLDETRPPAALELDRAREIVALLAQHKAKSAVPTLVGKLGDLRLRPYVADALAAIADPSAREPLLRAFVVERYRPTRVKLASALVACGAKDEMFRSLIRFAGVPEPLENAVPVARAAGLLVPKKGGLVAGADGGTVNSLTGSVLVPAGSFRVLVEGAGPGVATVSVAGISLVARTTAEASLAVAEGTGDTKPGMKELVVTHPAGVRAVLVVPLAEELPLPPKEAWDGGVSETDDPPTVPGTDASLGDAGLSDDAKAE